MPPTNTLAENFSLSVWDPKGFYDLQTTLHLKPLRENRGTNIKLWGKGLNWPQGKTYNNHFLFWLCYSYPLQQGKGEYDSLFKNLGSKSTAEKGCFPKSTYKVILTNGEGFPLYSLASNSTNQQWYFYSYTLCKENWGTNKRMNKNKLYRCIIFTKQNRPSTSFEIVKIKTQEIKQSVTVTETQVSRERSERILPLTADQKVTYIKFSLKSNTFAF